MIYAVHTAERSIIMNEKKSNNTAFNPERTRELQKDWQGYGKMTANYGLVVLVIFILSMLYHFFIS